MASEQNGVQFPVESHLYPKQTQDIRQDTQLVPESTYISSQAQVWLDSSSKLLTGRQAVQV
jgi:hypothetical protein